MIYYDDEKVLEELELRRDGWRNVGSYEEANEKISHNKDFKEVLRYYNEGGLDDGPDLPEGITIQGWVILFRCHQGFPGSSINFFIEWRLVVSHKDRGTAIHSMISDQRYDNKRHSHHEHPCGDEIRLWSISDATDRGAVEDWLHITKEMDARVSRIIRTLFPVSKENDEERVIHPDVKFSKEFVDEGEL